MKTISTLALFFCTASLAHAQAPAAPASEVIGVGNFLHIVGDAEKALVFYHDVLGMDVPPLPANAPPVVSPRPYLTTPEILALYDAPGAQYRVTNGMIAESPMRAELVEWQVPDRKPIHLRFQDPGAAAMVIKVRDLDAIMARVKSANATVVTLGGEPVVIRGSNVAGRAVVLQDPDGFFVELIQPDSLPESASQASNNIFNIAFSVAVADMDRTLDVFKAIGFQPQAGAWTSDAAEATLAGLPAAAQYRRATALVPGTSFEISFVEFKGVDRKTYSSTPRDPGTAMLRLRVRDVNSILVYFASAAVTVASKDRQAVTMTTPNGGQRFAILNGPDNLKIQVVQQIPKAN